MVGSSKRSMIYIKSANDNEYDHDIQNIYYNTRNPISDHTNNLRENFIDCLKQSFPNDGNNWNIENSTSVITIKKSW